MTTVNYLHYTKATEAIVEPIRYINVLGNIVDLEVLREGIPVKTTATIDGGDSSPHTIANISGVQSDGSTVYMVEVIALYKTTDPFDMAWGSIQLKKLFNYILNTGTREFAQENQISIEKSQQSRGSPGGDGEILLSGLDTVIRLEAINYSNFDMKWKFFVTVKKV